MTSLEAGSFRLVREGRMSILQSSVSTRDDKFKANAEAMAELTADLQAQREKAALGGDERLRHHLPAENALPCRDRALPAIKILLQPLQIEQICKHAVALGMIGL